jgi:anti-sigma-K factor RskA
VVMSMNELELKLREGAGPAQASPSPKLRSRTLQRLRDAEHRNATPTSPWLGSPRWSLIMGAALLAATLVLAALMTESRSPVDQKIAAVTNDLPSNSAVFNLRLPEIPDVSLAMIEEELTDPFRREVRLLVRDVERAVHHFAEHLPSLPRLSEPREHESIEQEFGALR